MEQKGKFEKSIEKWEIIRAKGKWRYCFIYGSLLQGGFMGIAMIVFDLISSDFSFKNSIFSLAFFIVIYFFIGKWQWNTRENHYQQYKDL